jgi:hypothetical protein
LPAKRLRRLVWNLDFRQKAACIKLSEDFRVDRIGLDLRMGDDAQTTSSRESAENIAAHVDTPQSLQLAVVPGDRLGEGAVGYPVR